MIGDGWTVDVSVDVSDGTIWISIASLVGSIGGQISREKSLEIAKIVSEWQPAQGTTQ